MTGPSGMTDEQIILRALRFYSAEANRIGNMPYIGKREFSHRQKHLDLSAEIDLLIMKLYGKSA